MKNVLLLNQDHTPLTVCSVKRAFLLIFLNKAELVEAIADKKLSSVSRSFPFPSIIKTKKYVSLPYKGVVMSRQNIFKRDNGVCQYCGINKSLTIDHIIPRSKGGKSTWTNLITACQNCNSKKGDQTPSEAGLTLNKMPVKPSHITFLRMIHGQLRKDWVPYLNPKKASA